VGKIESYPHQTELNDQAALKETLFKCGFLIIYEMRHPGFLQITLSATNKQGKLTVTM